MWLKLVCLVMALKLGLCRIAFMPKFYGEDSAVIVDTDKPLPKPIDIQKSAQMRPYYHAVHPYPMYQIIPSVNRLKYPPSKTSAKLITTTTTVMPDIVSNSDEFPKDLLYIAKHKLGLKSLDEVPTISALGELLGTTNPEETIKYIRQLTATDQGVALMKAYIESADYTDSTHTTDNDGEADEESDSDDNDNDEDTLDDMDLTTDLLTTTTTSTPKPQLGFLARMSAYFSNLLPQHNNDKPAVATTEQPKTVPRIITSFATQYHNQQQSTFAANSNIKPKPLLVRNPLPYHYPVPLRPHAEHANEKENSQKIAEQKVQFNASKSLMPHMQQLAKVTNIPPKKLETFLQNKPKLANLATKVSTFALSHDRNTQIDAQLLAAVEKAIEQDEDLKKLLSSTETLK